MLKTGRTFTSRWAWREDQGKTRAQLVLGSGVQVQSFMILLPGVGETLRSTAVVCFGIWAWDSLAELPSSSLSCSGEAEAP